MYVSLDDIEHEQDVLETLLEASKPFLPKMVARLDYLLATPFRYPPPRGGSRLRAEIDPGVFYCAGSSAAAELGYWRWRFLRAAVDLDHLDPVAQTAFFATPRTAGARPCSRPRRSPSRSPCRDVDVVAGGAARAGGVAAEAWVFAVEG